MFQNPKTLQLNILRNVDIILCDYHLKSDSATTNQVGKGGPENQMDFNELSDNNFERLTKNIYEFLQTKLDSKQIIKMNIEVRADAYDGLFRDINIDPFAVKNFVAVFNSKKNAIYRVLNPSLCCIL